MKAFKSILTTLLFCTISVGYSQEENNRPVVSANLPTIEISEGGTSNTIELLSYITDADNDNLVFEIVSAGNFQSNSGSALDGSSFIYVHNGAESISDEISFTVSDTDENGAVLSTESFSLTVQITAVNDSPSLPDQSISVDEGDQASGNIGATDPESNTLVYTLSTKPSNGEVILTGSTYTYVHDGGETTSDTFQITAAEVDDTSKSVTGTFTVAVSALNDSPQALDLSSTVLEGGSTSFSFSFDQQLAAGTVSFFDPDTDQNDVTIRVSSTPSNGTASVSGTELSYTHNGSETTTDSFTYEVFDGSLSSEYTVSLTVTPENDAPVATADTYFISSDDTSISVSVNTGVLQNDSDAENDALTVAVLEAPSSGSLTLNEDGSFEYEVVTAGFNTDSFTYTLSDANGSQSTAEVIIELSDLKPVPESYDLIEGDTLSIDDANGVLGNDSDSNNLEISSVLVSEPNHGTITLSTDGSFVYEHDGSENRNDQFTYKLENANGDESKATFVNLNISNVNDAPTASNTSITLNEGASLTFLPNYEDLDNEFIDLTFEVSTPESGNTESGVLTIDENGQLNFTHGGSELTSDLFVYTVSDGEFTSDPANIRITILPVNDAPVIDATDLALIADEGGSITKSITVNDAEQDSTSLLQVSGGEASYGSVQIDGTSIIYTHYGSTNFSDSFVLRSYDGTAFGSDVTFTVEINEVNDAPALKSGATTSYSLDEGASSTISLTNLFTDEEGDSITVSVSSATNGSLTDQGDGSFTYQHDGSETLTDSFTVTASDGVGESATIQKINLIISPVNDAPSIGGITGLEVDQLDELIIAPTISDPDNSSFTLSVSNITGSGEIEDNGDGTFTYIDATDDSNFSEDVQSTNFTFDLTVSDGTNSVVENVSIEVDNIDETLPQVVLRSNDTNLEEGETGTILVSLVDNTFYSKKRDLPSAYASYFQYVGEYNGHTYYYYTGGLDSYGGDWHSYSNASNIAKLVGGYPVVIESAEEENYVMGNTTSYFVGNERIWMGKVYNFENSTFEWINGASSTYQNWQNSYPSDAEGNPIGALETGNGWRNYNDDNGARVLVEFDKLAIVNTDITFNITAGGDATDTTDYGTVASTVTIPANSTSEVEIDVVVVDDTLDESGETITFTASADSNNTFYIKRSQSSLSFLINDNDDTTPGFTIGSETASGKSLSESDGEVTLTLSIANPKTFETSLLFDITGTATVGEDYQAKNIGYVDDFETSTGDVRAFAQSSVDGKIFFTAGDRLIKTYDPTNGFQSLNSNTNWGNYTTVTTNLANVRFRYIRDFDIDQNGNIYLIDDNYIRKINSSGLVSFIAGDGNWSNTPEDGKGSEVKFSDLREIASNSDGSVLYVFDRQRVRKVTFDENGDAEVTTLAGNGDWGHQDGIGTSARFADVQDIKVDSNGDLILVDNQRIRKVSGSQVTTIKQLNRNLHGLDIDSSGDYYMSARWANQLYKYDVSEDIVRTLIDSDGDGGTVNGPISEAKISSPQDVLFTSAGELLFAQPGNSQIRKIDFINKIRVKAGETTGDYVLTLTDDNFYENEETIILTPSSADGINISGVDPITLTLTSDDSLPEVQVNATNSKINEDAGAFLFTVSLGNAAEASAKNDLDPAYLNQFKFIGEFNGSKYYVSQNYYNWNDANTTAQSVGANLVVINDQEENDFIKSNIPNYSNSVWIGYNDKSQEGRFEWSSGSNSDFENWQNGEPNNSGDEDYVELMNNGKWNDLPQWSNLPFVVEFSGVKSSIDTRVTLQVEDSTSATLDSDFTAPESLIVTIPAGEDSATLSFAVTDDSENEAAEFINLTIVDINDSEGNPTGIISSTNGSASVEIIDNEASVVTLSASGSDLNESNSSITISVGSNIAKQTETAVVLAVNQGDSDTAVQNKDYYIPELDKIKTIAGSSRGYTDGIASEANFHNNTKMTAFGDQGYLIADRDNHVIRLLDKSGNVSTYIGNGNYRGNDNQNGADRLEARLSGPTDIAVSSTGEIYIVEQYSNAISKIDADGNYQIVANEYGNWGSEDNDDAKQATFNNPRAIAFDSQGNLYVADGENRIRKLTFSGNSASVETYAGNGEWGENNGDRSEARLSDPKDIIIDAQDNLYIAEHNRIRKIDAQGIVSTLAGSWWGENDGSLTSARFRNPTALAFDSSGNILVTDDDHNSLRIIYLEGDKAGQVQTLIGGNGSGFEDGAFGDAKLKRPRGVVADATRILVSDTENNRIREISLEPTIVIPAGELSGSITLLPIDDDVFELDESISLNLSSSSNVDLANSDLTTIDVNLVSDDAAPTVRISANKSTLNEKGGQVTVSLRLSDQFSSAKADMEESLKSNYYYLGEYNGSKYYASKSNQQWYQYNEAKRIAENLGGTLAIINTQQENDFITQRIFALDPNYSANDNRWLNHWIGYEYNQESESWEWNNNQNIQFANWQGDQYIRNPEGRPVARLHENGQWDNGEKNWHNQYVIEYSGAYSDVATNAGISYQLSGGAEVSDYSSSASETITITAGEYKGEFTITGVDDDSDEGIETILISLVEDTTDATIDANNSSVQIQIADDDLTTVTMSTDAGESISESNGAYSIIAELTNEKTYPVTVDLAFDDTTEGAAIFGLDFDSPSLNKISTLAGTGNYGFVDGEASIAQFESDIRSMVTDKDGNLYIADSNRSVIRKFDRVTNTVSSYVGNPNGGGDENEGNRSDVRVGFIRAMASDTLNNRLYFWDDWTRLVRRVNLETGQVSFVAGDGSGNGSDGSAFEASFQNISAMTIGSNGDVYLIDNTQLKKITISEGSDAIVSTLAGEYNNGGFNDGFGNEVRISWADQKGMALDLDGNIVFTDGNQHRVRKYNVITGEVTTIAGQWWDYADGVGTNARFKNPIGLAITANGDIYVADAEDKRIRKIVKQDNGSYLVSTVAGNGNNGYEDGEASSSQFGNPLHLATFGNQLAVFDQGNAAIRQIQLTPTITIPAGQKIGTFQVTAVDDVVYETDEQIAVSVTPSGANLTGDSSFATILTSDDNIPIVALEASNTIVKENGGTLEVELTLLDQEGAEVIWARNDLSEDTKQSFNFLGEFEGHKYYQSFNEVTFEEALSVALSLGGQLLVLDSQEENEFIGRTIRNGSWLGITDADTEGVWSPLYGDSTYQNFDSNNNEPNGGTNENYAVTYGNQWYDVNSGNRHSFIIEFGPTKASGLDTVITLAVAGTATNEAQGEDVADFTLSAQQVTIPAGSNSATVSIITGNDNLDESIETIELSIADIATFNDEAVATISQVKNNLVVEIDDDEAPEVSFSLSSNSLAENKGSTTLTATLSNPKVSDTEVRFAFAGEATFLDDYRSSDLGLVETVAGVYKGAGYVNGSADVARFNTIWGMVPYVDGSYLLSDRGNNAIRKLNSDGSVENFIGNGNGWGNEAGLRSSVSVNRPTYLAVDDNYNVYFATQNNKIYKYDVESDRVEIIAGNGQYSYADGVGQSSSFRNPTDIEVNSDGSLIYVVDYDNKNIRLLTRGEDNLYTVSSLTNGNHNGNDNLVTGSFENAQLGRPYEIDVDWDNNKIYAISAIEWGYGAMLVLDLDASIVGSTIIATDNGSWRYWGFDRDEAGNFYLSDSQNRTIVKMKLGKPGLDRYTDEETGWVFQSHQNNDLFKFYRLSDDPNTIEAVVEYTFSGGSTLRLGGFNDGETYGLQSNNMVITNTSDYFRYFEPGIYKIQINTNNLTYSVTSTSDVPTRGYTLSNIAGGERGYVDGTGEEAQFNYPSAIVVNGSSALVYDDGNELLRSIRVQTALIVEGRNTTASVDFRAYKDQYFEGEEVIELSIAGIDNGVSATSAFDPITITDATFLTRVNEAPFEGVQDGKVSWGDYDRDGDMDLLLMGSGVDGTITNIYRNNDGSFENTGQNFTKYLGGDAEFVDVDQDGWLDVALSGNSPIGRVSELYINRGSDSPSAPFFQLSTNYIVEGLSQSDMEWGDLDNDGDPDLIISGINEENQYKTLYYTNLGNYTFLQEQFFYADGKIQAEIDMFDADNDGDLDVGIAGINEGDGFGSQFYTNSYYDASQNFDANYNFNNYRWLRDGKTMFLDLDVDSRMDYFAMGLDENRNTQQVSNLGVSLTPLNNPDFAFADYNNDGLNDVVITGEDEQGNPVTKLYVTLGGVEFGYRLFETDVDLVALRESTVDWIDYDLDGDLDLFMTGIDDSGVPVSVLYEANNVANLNEAPAKVTNLTAVHAGNGLVQLDWDKPTDNANSEFRYALRVGTSSGASDVLYVNATETGTRLIDEPSLATLNSRELILNPGTYFAAVQAIDAGNRGGAFSDEIQFTVDYSWKRLNLGGIIDRSLRPKTGSQIEFVDYDGDGDMDLIGSNVGTDYTWNGSSINIFGFENGVFVPKQQEGGGSSTFGLGDLNKNGFVDIIYAQQEQSGSRIHSAFNMQPIILERIANEEDVSFMSPFQNENNFQSDNLIPSLYDAKVAIKDLNNDGMPEVILAGASSQIESEATAAVYLLRMNLNDGETELGFDNFYFTYEKLIENNASLEGLSFLSFDLGDVDGDADYDLLFTGFGFDGYETILFENTGNLDGELFVETNNNFIAVREGSASFIDIDGDGLLDVVFSGQSSDGDTFRVYKNTGNIQNFAALEVGLPAIRQSNVDFGDFNEDGYYDILYSGTIQGEGRTTRLAEFNPSNRLFEDSEFDVSSYLDANVGFGDFDGDGDLDFVLSGEDANNDSGQIQQIADIFINVRDLATAQNSRISLAKEGNNSGLGAPTISRARRRRIAENSYEVTVDWDGAKNKNGNPDSALTYELKVGTSKNGTEVLSTIANADGVRAVATTGNAESNKSWKLNLPEGTYFAQVQAVDASYQGSEFSDIFEFAVVNSFKLGDANGDDVVNVLDLTTNIEYIMTGVEPTAFVPEVADVNLDGAINVTDISGIVEIILNPETSTSRIALSKAVDKSDYFSNKVVGDAKLALQNGAVKLRSDREVVALQFSVNKDAAIRLNDRLSSNFNVVNFERDNRIHYLVYSLNNQNILGVTDQLFTVSGNTKLDVSDLAANAAGVGTLSIEFLDESYLDQYNNGAVFYPNPARDVASLYVGLEDATRVQVELFNMQGTSVLQYATEKNVDQINLNVSNLSSGLYAARIQITTEDGRTVTRSLKLVIQ